MKRIWWIFVGSLMLATVQAASFDCAKANTGVEKLICKDELISRLDSQLGRAYQLAMNDASMVRKPELKAEQKNWIETARNACVDSACLLDQYSSRLRVLTLIKTGQSEANYVVDQKEYSSQIMDFRKSLHDVGVPGKFAACKMMVNLAPPKDSMRQSASYGAICSLGDRDVMICDETMVGKLTIKFYGYAETGADVSDFTEANCPSGG